MKIGETKQLTILAPPRIDVAFIFLSYYGTEIWSIRNPSESWNNWVARDGMNGDNLKVLRVEPDEGASLYTLNSTERTGGTSIPVKISIKRDVSAAYVVDEGGLFSSGFVDGRTVFNSIARMSDETFDPISPDLAVGYLDRWAGQGNAAYEDAAQFLIAEMTSYGLRVEAQRFAITDINNNFNPELIFIVGMPRSGSTLLETILSVNQKVFDC